VLARALAKAPEDRYQRGVDLVTELDRAIDRHSTHGQATPTVAESMRPTTSGARPWASNFWVPILAVAIALGILVAGMLARSLANGRIDSSTGSQDVQESSQAEGGATAFAAAPQASARPASSPVPGSVALTDSFDDPANGRLPRTSPRPNDYLLAYEAGEYRMQKVNPQFTTSAIAPIPGEYDDIALAVTVRFVGDLDRRFATLACRIQSGSSSRYAMFFNAGTRMVRLYRYDPGSAPGAPLTEWTRGPDVRPAAQSNRLELSCAGNMIAGRVNDRLVVSASDSTYTVGRVWLSVGTFADNPNMAEARFDDLVVSQARP
jgi:hypothetical protein